MDALQSLTSRTSPKLLGEPGPDDAALAKILTAACAAPDHGKLKPWRFLVIRGKARERLGDLLAETTKRREPSLPPDAIERDRVKPMRSPIIVVVVAKAMDNPKIPRVEQIISAGIAAQNILLASHSLGFAGKWSTGAAAYDPEVKKGLGLAAEDDIVGFLYLGAPAGDPPIVRRPEYTSVTQEWTDRATVTA